MLAESLGSCNLRFSFHLIFEAPKNRFSLGSHNIITGKWNLNLQFSSRRRLFTVLELIMLKGLHQVLHSIVNRKFPFQISFFCCFIDLYCWILNVDAVKNLYDKMLESVNVKRSMPPNAWLWSMIASCKHHHDISLLFDILRNLRRFVSFYSLLLSPFFFLPVIIIFLYWFTLFAMMMNLICLMSRGCQIFAYMTILTATSVVKLLRHVFMPEPLILVCFICVSVLSFIKLCCSIFEIWRCEMKLRFFGLNVWAGKKALWKHNIYGLAPSVASAHHLLVLLDILMS